MGMWCYGRSALTIYRCLYKQICPVGLVLQAYTHTAMSQQALDLPNIDWPKLRDTILASSIYALTGVNNWCRLPLLLHEVVYKLDHTLRSNQAPICRSWSFDMHLC